MVMLKTMAPFHRAWSKPKNYHELLWSSKNCYGQLSNFASVHIFDHVLLNSNMHGFWHHGFWPWDMGFMINLNSLWSTMEVHGRPWSISPGTHHGSSSCVHSPIFYQKHLVPAHFNCLWGSIPPRLRFHGQTGWGSIYLCRSVYLVRYGIWFDLINFIY